MSQHYTLIYGKPNFGIEILAIASGKNCPQVSSCCICCLPDLLCRINHVVSALHFDKEIQWYPKSLSASLTSLSISFCPSQRIRLSPYTVHLSQTKLNALTHALIKTNSVFVSREGSEKQWPSAALSFSVQLAGPSRRLALSDDFLFHFGSWRAMLYLYPGFMVYTRQQCRNGGGPSPNPNSKLFSQSMVMKQRSSQSL